MPVRSVEAPITTPGHPITLVAVPASAEFPFPAGGDLDDKIDPIASVVLHPASTFWWRVEGDCLWDAGIRDGGIIAADRAGKRRLGRAVPAVIGGAVTPKILRKRDGKYFLAPASGRRPSWTSN